MQTDRIGSWEVSGLRSGAAVAGPHREGEAMHGPEKSDPSIVAMKQANKTEAATFSHRSTAGSPKGLIRATSKKPECCSTSCLRERSRGHPSGTPALRMPSMNRSR